MPVQDFTDRGLLLFSIEADQYDPELDAEMARRWPGGAERLAQYFTASHASLEDRRRMAIEETDLVVAIAAGTHTHDARYGVCCSCGWSPRDVWSSRVV